jgi:SHS2 domain-containing protein
VKRPGYRRLPHTADLRLVVWGDSREELCRHAVRGALHEALGKPPRGVPSHYLPVDELPEDETLVLARIVNEALFQLYVHGVVATDVRWEGGRPFLGVRQLRPGQLPEVEVKAATLHGLDTARVAGRWRATLTLDL